MPKKAKNITLDKVVKILLIFVFILGAIYLQIKIVPILNDLKINIFNSEQANTVELPPLETPPAETPLIEQTEPQVVEKTVVIKKVVEVPVEAKAPKALPGSIFQD